MDEDRGLKHISNELERMYTELCKIHNQKLVDIIPEDEITLDETIESNELQEIKAMLIQRNYKGEITDELIQALLDYKDIYGDWDFDGHRHEHVDTDE